MAEDNHVTPRPWAQGVEPTPDQLASFLAICTHQERVAYVTAMRNLARDAQRCFVENHDGALRRIEDLPWANEEWSEEYRRGYDKAVSRVSGRPMPAPKAQEPPPPMRASLTATGEVLVEALTPLADTLDEDEGPVILAYSVAALAYALDDRLACLAHEIVPVDR